MDLFAGVSVSDYPRACAWYERLLGFPPTFVPHDTESVWTLAEQRSVYVVLRPEHAGHATVTAFLDDLDGFLDAAAGRGMVPDDVERYDNGVRKAVFHDPDGNELGFGGGPRE